MAAAGLFLYSGGDGGGGRRGRNERAKLQFHSEMESSKGNNRTTERNKELLAEHAETSRFSSFEYFTIPSIFVFDLLLLFFVRRVACSIPSSWYPGQAFLYRISFLHPRDDWNVLIINQQQNVDLVFFFPPQEKWGSKSLRSRND